MKLRGRWMPVTMLLVVVGLVLSGCASDAELDSLDPAGSHARSIDNLFMPVFWVAVVIGVLVGGASIYMFVRFRRRDDDDDEFPEQTEGNTRLEILWTLVPAIILAVIAVFTVNTLFTITDVKAEEDELLVEVVGNQWWWEYRYHFDGDLDTEPDLVTATQMVIPVGEFVPLKITSNDVIHSFWIPRLNGKKDAAPGRVHDWSLDADEPGVYWGSCTEFCGLSHANMKMQVVALEPADYEAWLDEQLEAYAAPDADDQAFIEAVQAGDDVEATTAVQRGMETFRAQCSSCHLARGVNDDIYDAEAVANSLIAGVAPDLTHFASRTTYAGGIFYQYDDEGNFDVNTLEAWLRNPPAMKPAAAGDMRGMPNLNLSATQIDDLVAFLTSTGAPPADWVITETNPEN